MSRRFSLESFRTDSALDRYCSAEVPQRPIGSSTTAAAWADAQTEDARGRSCAALIEFSAGVCDLNSIGFRLWPHAVITKGSSTDMQTIINAVGLDGVGVDHEAWEVSSGAGWGEGARCGDITTFLLTSRLVGADAGGAGARSCERPS